MHPAPAAVQHVGVYLRRFHILVSEQFLYRADVVAVIQQVGGETVPQGMCAYGFVQTDQTCRLPERAVQVRVIPAPLLGRMR